MENLVVNCEERSIITSRLMCGIETLSSQIVELNNRINASLTCGNPSYIETLEEQLFNLENQRRLKINRMNEMLKGIH